MWLKKRNTAINVVKGDTARLLKTEMCYILLEHVMVNTSNTIGYTY